MILLFNNKRAGFPHLLQALIMMAVMMVCPVSGADKPAVSNNIGAVRISADSLTVPGGTENYAEFSGNVHATGDRFEITADQLKIYYQQSGADTGGNANAGNTLNKIIAIGNVVITSGEKIAKTEQAVYDNSQQTIILSGENSAILQNNSYISGGRIIMHLDTEAFTVESGEGQRPEAFIEPQDIKNNN